MTHPNSRHRRQHCSDPPTVAGTAVSVGLNLVVLAVVLFAGSRLYDLDHQRTQEVFEQARNERARMKLVDNHLYELLLKALEANKRSAAAQVDERGIVVWSNARYRELFGKSVGSALQEILPEGPTRDNHTKTMLAAIRSHGVQGPTFTWRRGKVVLSSGEIATSEVRSWTTETGGACFIDLVSEEE